MYVYTLHIHLNTPYSCPSFSFLSTVFFWFTYYCGKLLCAKLQCKYTNEQIFSTCSYSCLSLALCQCVCVYVCVCVCKEREKEHVIHLRLLSLTLFLTFPIPHPHFSLLIVHAKCPKYVVIHVDSSKRTKYVVIHVASSSRDSLGRLHATIDILIGPHMAVASAQLNVHQIFIRLVATAMTSWQLCTDDVILLMTGRQFYNEGITVYFSFSNF